MEKKGKNMNKHFETLAIGVICTVFVLSMHQSCSDLSKKVKIQEKTETKNTKKIKNNTINTAIFNKFTKQR